MDSLMMESKRKLNFAKGWGLAAHLLLALLLLIVTACQSNSAGSATEAAPATQPPTATPVPPTATSVPPTATPTEEAVDDRVQRAIKYLDLDDPYAAMRTVDIYLPEASGAPYPTVIVLTTGGDRPMNYTDLAQEFVARGYAVVVVRVRTSNSSDPYRLLGEEDTHCAFAWLMVNTTTYGLDPQRMFVFGHDSGGFVAVNLPLHDEAAWADSMKECPYPMPDRTAIKGVITYHALLGIPAGILGAWPVEHAVSWGIPEAEMMAGVKALRAAPPQKWHESGLLDDHAMKLARLLPLYWVYQARDAQAPPPPYLLLYDGGSFFSVTWALETGTMAEAMQAVGMAVTLQSLSADSEVTVAQVAAAADAFIREISK